MPIIRDGGVVAGVGRNKSVRRLERPAEFDDDGLTQEYDAINQDSDDFGAPDGGDDPESMPGDDDADPIDDESD